MVPYFDDGQITIYCGDCRDVLPTLDMTHVGLVLTDPPYGLHWVPRVNHRDGPWKDTERAALPPALLSVPKVCIWGGNYYADQLPCSESWLIWLKRPPGFDDDPRTYAVAELAWTNYGGKPRTRTLVWDGGKRAGAAVNRTFCHPAQKPLELMQWAITSAGAFDGAVLDPFMGAGSTLEAAKSMGRRAIGIEIDEGYCASAVRRLAQGVLPWEVG